MPIIDPGITVVDDLGRPLLSKDAIHLPKPPDISSIGPDPNNRMPAVMQGANAVVPTPQSLGQTPETGPILNQRQGPGTLPQTSIPSEIYKMGASQAPDRNDPSLQHHGLAKFGDILTSLAGGPFAPLVYQAMKQVPFQQARNDWATKLAAIKPEVEHEQFQTRERREGEQAGATLAETKREHDSQIDNQKLIEEHRLAGEKSTQERIDAENKRLALLEQEAADRRKEAEERIAKEKQPGLNDKAAALYAKRASGQILSPDEIAQLKGFEQLQNVTKTQPGVMRMEALGDTRMRTYLDSSNNNTPVDLSVNEYQNLSKSDPNRFIPSGVGTPALKNTALIEDVRGNINQLRGALKALPEDFGGLDKAKIAFALRSNDPKGAINQLISGGALGNLTSQQQDYIIAVTDLIETAQSLRKPLGGGQGRDVRAAIEGIIPGPTTPNRSYATKQLDSLEKIINRLEQGIPKVPLGNAPNGPQVNDPHKVVINHRRPVEGN